jgi:site-specific DNA recombinase
MTKDQRSQSAPTDPGESIETLAGMHRAVIYLRVSTAGQVKTDRDAEGFSIPAQREACLRKAESLGAYVLDEYVDAGESARSADRAQLNAMLERLARDRDIDYVIVHKIDRLARNRVDDVAINLAIREAGAQIVSVSENIDETPSGMLLHGIMSSIAEFYSSNLATEITKGMHQKAKKGVHPGRAPIGYLNVREISDGFEIRTIAVDPERAPLIRWAFEAYATGDYTIAQLAEELEAKGLTTRATAKLTAKPLAIRHVHKLLHNTFYVGLMTWGGVERPGTHAPLVDIDTFARVNAVLASHRNGPEKQRKHNHYLRSTIFCNRCKSRVVFTRSRGRGGEYDYFMCLGRHQRRTDCDLPAIPVGIVEDDLERYYATIQLGDDTVLALHDKLVAAMQRYTGGAEKRARQQRKRITALEAERRKLLQAYTAGAIELDLLKEEQARLTKQIADAGAALAATEVHWETIERNLRAAIGLAQHFGTAYARADKQTKRHMNQAVFEAVYIDVDGITYARLADPFVELLADDLMARLDWEMKHPQPTSPVGGVKESTLVDLRGLEPRR